MLSIVRFPNMARLLLIKMIILILFEIELNSEMFIFNFLRLFIYINLFVIINLLLPHHNCPIINLEIHLYKLPLYLATLIQNIIIFYLKMLIILFPLIFINFNQNKHLHIRNILHLNSILPFLCYYQFMLLIIKIC